MARAPLKAGLLLVAFAALPVSAGDDAVAREFLEAFRAGDAAAELALAVRPLDQVDYGRVVEWLLARGERAAAERLALHRAQAPDGAGLRAALEAPRPPPDRWAAIGEAAAHLGAGRPGDALRALDAAAPPPDAGFFAAAFHGARAEALLRLGKDEETIAAARAACAAARGVSFLGQWLRGAELWRAAAARAGDARAGIEALSTLLDAARVSGRSEAQIESLVARARLHRSLRSFSAAREDLAAAKEIEEARGGSLAAARLAMQIGTIFLADEAMPARALGFFEEALPALEKAASREETDAARFNAAVALTQAGRYAEALRRLDEAGGLGGRTAAQRAYVLRRQGRLDAALAAYEGALAEAGERRPALLVELGELHLLRWETRRARERFLEAGDAEPLALLGLAHVAAAEGDPAAAEEWFERSLAAGADAARLHLRRGAVRLRFGDPDGALRDAARAIEILKDRPSEFGNAGVAWLLVGECHLALGDEAKAAAACFNAATVHFRSRDPERAVPAYLRTATLLQRAGKAGEALERLGAAFALSEGRDDLRSMERRVSALHSREPLPLLDEAERRAGGDPELLAGALSARAILFPAEAPAIAERILALLDERPETIAGRELDLEGENPFVALPVAIAELARTGDAARAFPLLDRLRRERLLRAFGGRDSYLAAVLPEEKASAWARDRARLLDARAAGGDASEAEGALRRRLDALRDAAPLALLPAESLERARSALGESEALVVLLDDRHGSAALVARRDRAGIGPLFLERPLDALAPLLEGATRILAIADGTFAGIPLETARFRDAPLGAKFEIRLLPFAGALASAAGAKGPPRALGPAELRFDRPASTRLDGRPPLSWLRGPPVEGPLLLEGVTVSRAAAMRGDGVQALVAALLHRGAGGVAAPMLDVPPPGFLAELRDGVPDLASALFETKRRFRERAAPEDPRVWASVVYWGR